MTPEEHIKLYLSAYKEAGDRPPVPTGFNINKYPPPTLKETIDLFKRKFTVPQKPVNPKLAQRPSLLTQTRAFLSKNPAQVINGQPPVQKPVLRASK